MNRDCRSIFEETIQATEKLWSFHTTVEPIDNADIAVCLGSYDIRVANCAASLVLNGIVSSVIVSGGFGNWTRGVFQRTEAEVFAEKIEECGVSRKNIFEERASSNIGENIEFSKRMSLNLVPKIGSAIFVTKPQTKKRVLATAQKRWHGIDIYVTSPAHTMLEQATIGGLPALIDEMVGDIERILIYPDLGFQAELSIDDDVLKAYEQLKFAGFDQHCLSRHVDKT